VLDVTLKLMKAIKQCFSVLCFLLLIGLHCFGFSFVTFCAKVCNQCNSFDIPQLSLGLCRHLCSVSVFCCHLCIRAQ